MNQREFINTSENSMTSHVLQSLGMHLLIVGLIIMTSIIFLHMREDLIIVNKKLIEASIRVDVVAMPTLTLKEMQALENQDRSEEPPEALTQAAEKTVDSESKDDFVPDEKPKASFADMIKNLGSKVDEKKAPKNSKVSSDKNQKGLSKNSKDELSKLLVAGNKLSQGTALTGTGEAQELSAVERYAAGLPDQIKQHWRLPTYLMDQVLNCRVRVYIAADGRLLKAIIHQSSGNEEYDNRAIQSIVQSAPFLPPDPSFKDRTIRGEIVLGFPL